MEHRMTPRERGFLPAADAALVARAFGFEALSEENLEALEQLTHVCDACFCPGDFRSPWDAIGHVPISRCAQIWT